MKENILISVVIPTYKQQGGLIRALESVLNQTYTNIEVIVVDDNDPKSYSRKQTELEMSSYLSNPRVFYIRHPQNKNGAAARNTGIKAANGEYIAFLDDDDEWQVEKLERQIQYMKNHQDVDAVYTYIYSGNSKSYSVPYEGNAIIPLLMDRTRMYTSSLLMTASSVQTIGGFDESFKRHQDYELLAKFFKYGYKIGCLPVYLVKYSSLGGNAPKGESLLALKDKFLKNFDGLINEIDSENPGVKNKIYASNYALCFYIFIATKNFRLAWSVFKKWFPNNPSSFISQILFLIRGKIYKFLH